VLELTFVVICVIPYVNN